VSETIPTDMPKPLGKHVVLTHYFNANLYHDMMTGRSFTHMLHLFNKSLLNGTPKSKQQSKLQHMVWNLLLLAHVLNR
jgi:hypothetical protein